MVYFSKREIKRKRKRRVKEPLTEDLLDELLSAPDPVKFAGKHRLHGRDLPSNCLMRKALCVQRWCARRA